MIFEENSYLYYDLASAYHHIPIARENTSLLGFSIPADDGNILYYVFNALPFGIKTAGHIFTNLLKVVVSFLRAKRHKVIMFLDDGIGGHTSYRKSMSHTNLDLGVQSSQYVRQTLLDFGFLLAHEKCNWFPSEKVTWLGHTIDMEKKLLFISDEKIKRLQAKLVSVAFQIKSDRYNLILVRVLESVVGQIILLQSVISTKVRLRTRELFKCINTRASWNAPVLVSDAALAEIEFWKTKLYTLSMQGKPLKDSELSLYSVFVDASAVGYGGYIECYWQNIVQLQNEEQQSKVSAQFSRAEILAFPRPPEVENIYAETGSSETDFLLPSEMGSGCIEKSPEVDTSRLLVKGSIQASVTKKLETVLPVNVLMDGSEVLGNWNEHEQGSSSTWRETEAVSRLIRSHAEVLKDSVIKVYSDNKNVKSVLMSGSTKPDIQNIAINLNNFCDKENITLRTEWIPRKDNAKAAYLSRCKDSDDWEISPVLFQLLDSQRGICIHC